ncbi:response regulator [Xanthocytophaga agilis]|uniref:Response regulator n=1 Tax=Xanthocytophaga agilis TaxID=3048010 RepID=A0AAE3RCK0_9BACT|nr:response regulator [Xanthocytophaga agilis]MDJ1505118.1 response regulator [Xanthocytophaga agilis]
MRSILLIEDNTEVRENTAEILQLASYRVFTAPNGKAGVEIAKAEKPDLIICDIMMPELDGYGVLHLLSRDPNTAGIPFIFLTAKTEKEDFRKGMNLGADDYLTKPFDDLTLLDAIEMRLRKTDTLRKTFQKDAEGLTEFINEAKSTGDLNQLLNGDRKVIRLKKKQLLFSEGDYPSALYFISKGKVKTYKTNEEGREYITALHSEGDFVGYTDLLEESQYNESAAALDDAEIIVVNRQDFFTLLYQNREVANKFIKMLSNDVIEKEERLLKLAYNSVRKRVAESLLMIYDRYTKEGQNAPEIPVSREDLSSLAGASKETVIRTLSDFKDEKLIDISGKHIRLLNLAKLKNMRN